MLKIGDLVSISVLGNQIGSLQLSGEIMEMEDTVDVGNGQPLIRVIVQLDNPSLAQINAPFNSKQFSGRNSRSEIHFTLPDIGLSKFLIRATGDLLMSNVRL